MWLKYVVCSQSEVPTNHAMLLRAAAVLAKFLRIRKVACKRHCVLFYPNFHCELNFVDPYSHRACKRKPWSGLHPRLLPEVGTACNRCLDILQAYSPIAWRGGLHPLATCQAFEHVFAWATCLLGSTVWEFDHRVAPSPLRGGVPGRELYLSHRCCHVV